MKVCEEKKHTDTVNESRYNCIGSAYCSIKFVQSSVTKRNLIDTLDALNYMANIPFLRKLKDYKCVL